MYEREITLVNQLYPEIVRTAEELTGFERGTKVLRGLEETANYLTKKLEELGCEVKWYTDDIYGNTIVAKKRGKGKIKILLYAHMDTVWPEGSTKEMPFRLDGNRIYGAGVSDCTQGILASIYTLKTLNQLGFDDYGELTIIFNPDEELTSPSSTKWIKEYSEDADIAFCMEGPERADEFTTARAGSAYYEIKIKGKMAHAGCNPEDGANALEEMVYKMNDILAKKFPEVYLVVCWIKGGNGDCIVADNAYAMLRYRIKAWDVFPEIDAFLKQVGEKTYVSGTTTSITFWPEGGFGPMPKLPWMNKFVDLVVETSKEMGIPLKEGYSYGGCDAASTVMNCPTLDGLSPVTYHCHSRNESLDLDTVVPRIALLSVIFQRLSTNDKYLKNENGN